MPGPRFMREYSPDGCQVTRCLCQHFRDRAIAPGFTVTRRGKSGASEDSVSSYGQVLGVSTLTRYRYVLACDGPSDMTSPCTSGWPLFFPTRRPLT